MIASQTSIVIPFYNTPPQFFAECIESAKRCSPKEIILVDDCSSNPDVVALAKASGCEYLKTPYQSGHDGFPFNTGVKAASGTYICKLDSDDMLLALPKAFEADVYFSRNRRVNMHELSLKALILAPRALCNGMVVPKELLLKYPFAEDKNVFSDVLFALRLLHHEHTFEIAAQESYFYRKRSGSIQTSMSEYLGNPPEK